MEKVDETLLTGAEIAELDRLSMTSRLAIKQTRTGLAATAAASVVIFGLGAGMHQDVVAIVGIAILTLLGGVAFLANDIAEGLEPRRHRKFLARIDYDERVRQAHRNIRASILTKDELDQYDRLVKALATSKPAGRRTVVAGIVWVVTTMTMFMVYVFRESEDAGSGEPLVGWTVAVAVLGLLFTVVVAAGDTQAASDRMTARTNAVQEYLDTIEYHVRLEAANQRSRERAEERYDAEQAWLRERQFRRRRHESY